MEETSFRSRRADSASRGSPSWLARPPVAFVLWLLALALSLAFVRHTIASSTRASNGFGSYFAASHLLLEGADVADFYDDSVFSRSVEALAGVYDIYNVNPPTTALLLLPLAGLSHDAARILWTIFCALLLAALLVAAGRRERGHRLAILLAFTAAYQPLWEAFKNGQAYVPLLALLVLVWIGEYRDRPALTGVGLGLLMSLKTAGVLLPLWLLVRRRFRSLLWTGAVGAAVVAFSLPWLGLEAWRVYLGELPALRDQPWLAATAFQTHTSWLRHLLVGGYQGEPIVAAPALAAGLETFVLVLTVAFCAALAARSAELAAPFSCFVLANLVLSPVSVSHHYVLALLPIWLLARRGITGSVERTVLGTGALLIAADLPYLSQRLYDGYWALLAYPKLAGAVCLFAVAAKRAWRSASKAAPSPAGGGAVE